MNRNEFLRILKESLAMSLEQDAIKEQLDYYDKYISDEMSKGRSEKEVLDELGDPRLIAKTIKTVNVTNDVKNENNYSDTDDTKKTSNSGSSSHQGRKYTSYVNTSGIGCVLAGLVTFIIIIFVFRLFGYMAYGIGSLAFSGPIGFLLVLGLLYFFFGGGRRR